MGLGWVGYVWALAGIDSVQVLKVKASIIVDDILSSYRFPDSECYCCQSTQLHNLTICLRQDSAKEFYFQITFFDELVLFLSISFTKYPNSCDWVGGGEDDEEGWMHFCRQPLSDSTPLSVLRTGLSVKDKKRRISCKFPHTLTLSPAISCQIEPEWSNSFQM